MHDLTESQKRAQEADRQARESTIQMWEENAKRKREEDEERMKSLGLVLKEEPTEQEPTEQEQTERERTVPLTTSVPQSLKARIDALRQAGNGFNVSEFVTAVLLKKLDREEELARIQKPLVARLRREKYDNAENLEQMGRKEAQRDVGSMSLAEFMAVDALDLSEFAAVQQFTSGEDVIANAAEAALDRLDLENDSERLTFLCAYFQELQTIWDEIKDEI